MKHNVEFKHFEPNERVRSLVEDLINRVPPEETKRQLPDKTSIQP